MQNYIKTPNNKLIHVNLRYGKTGFIKSYGLDLHYKLIWTYKNFSFSNKLSVWQQPQLNKVRAKDAANRLGLAEILHSKYKLNNHASLYGEIGYKTSGYLPGIPLENGVVFGLGFNFNI